jgi:hypothetical protein
MAPIGDLVDADTHEPFQPARVEVFGDHAGDDRPDRVPTDP